MNTLNPTGVDSIVNRRVFLAACALMLASSVAHAQEPPPPLMIIVNERSTLKSVSKEELRNVYLGKLGFWSDNTKVTVFDRPVDREAGTSFYRDVLKMVPARFRHHWQSQQLSGRGIAPEPIANAEDVIARVAAAPGGISYLHTSEVPRQPPKGVLLIPITPDR